MKGKVRIFLESDLLERYLLDNTSREESLKVERYIAMYPEVRESYEELQANLEVFVKLYARKTPDGLKDRIMASIRKENQRGRKTRFYAFAASVTALLLAVSTYFFYMQNQQLQVENTVVENKIRVLEADMKERLEDVRNQFIVLNNPETRTFTVKGNKKAKELKAVAYVNPVKKLSYINVQNLPNLPESQCYQMWAEVNGEMINLGVIESADGKDKLRALPYAEEAIGYITIEPQGGNVTPTVQNIVANIQY